MDFLKAKSYYEQDQFVVGTDNSLVVEFFQAELLIHAQHQTVTPSSSGTNQAFVCEIVETPKFECLDIAGASTLSGIWNDTYTATSAGANLANTVLDTDLMLDLTGLSVRNESLTNRYGLSTNCDGKIVGDGVVNGLDLFVMGASQFRLGPYHDIGSDLSAIATTQGRPETMPRCGEALTRLDWQNRIAYKACFALEDESAYLSARRRRLTAPSDGRQLSQDSIVSIADLDVKPFLWSSASPLGNWYLLNVPMLVVSIELFVRGAEEARPTQLNNEPPPEFNTSMVPTEANKYDLRFQRHRERLGLPTDECSVVEASGSQLSALTKGTIAVSQRLSSSSQLCAFDIFLFIPKFYQSSRPSNCLLEIASGSTAMDGLQGAHQEVDRCVSYSLGVTSSPPPALSPPPASPIDDGSVQPLVLGATGLGLAVIAGSLAWVFMPKSGAASAAAAKAASAVTADASAGVVAGVRDRRRDRRRYQAITTKGLFFS